jgi:3-oxoacyl-ACP reductase-like protein
MSDSQSNAAKALQAAEAKKALDAKKAADAEAAAKIANTPTANTPTANTPTANTPTAEELEAEAKIVPVFKKGEFVNPFTKGVTYDIFDKALEGKSVEEYCKGHLEPSEIAWISTEINHYRNNKKK